MAQASRRGDEGPRVAPSAGNKHLVVLQHGLFGSPLDMAFVEEELRRCTSAARVLVLNSGVNAGSGTYDGVDVAGDRLAALVLQFCEQQRHKGAHVTHISFIGYSLGGLIVRYAMGKLAARGFFKAQVPSPPSNATAPRASTPKPAAAGQHSKAAAEPTPATPAGGSEQHASPPRQGAPPVAHKPLAGPFSPLQRRRQRSAPQLQSSNAAIAQEGAHTASLRSTTQPSGSGSSAGPGAVWRLQTSVAAEGCSTVAPRARSHLQPLGPHGGSDSGGAGDGSSGGGGQVPAANTGEVTVPSGEEESRVPDGCPAAPPVPNAAVLTSSLPSTAPSPPPSVQAAAAATAAGREEQRQGDGGDVGVVPVNLVTFASPHLGCWQPVGGNLYRQAYNSVLPYTLSRTGSQLVLADSYLSPDATAPAHRRAARRTPLLAVMSDPSYAFHAALAMMQKRVVLANVRHDATVPYLTSSIALGSPYLSDPGRPISPRYPCIIVPTAAATAAHAAPTAAPAPPAGQASPHLRNPHRRAKRHNPAAPSLRLRVSATSSAMANAAAAPVAAAPQHSVAVTSSSQSRVRQWVGTLMLLRWTTQPSLGQAQHAQTAAIPHPSSSPSRQLLQHLPTLLIGWPTMLIRAASLRPAAAPAFTNRPLRAASASAITSTTTRHPPGTVARHRSALPTTLTLWRSSSSSSSHHGDSSSRAPPPAQPPPVVHGTRLRGDVFACTLPVLLLLWHAMLLWLFVQSATHYLLLFTCQVKRDLSWDVRWRHPDKNNSSSSGSAEAAHSHSPPQQPPATLDGPSSSAEPSAAPTVTPTPHTSRRRMALATKRVPDSLPALLQSAAAEAAEARPGHPSHAAWRRVVCQGLDWLALARECAQPCEPWEMVHSCYELSLSLVEWWGAVVALIWALARGGWEWAWRRTVATFAAAAVLREAAPAIASVSDNGDGNGGSGAGGLDAAGAAVASGEVLEAADGSNSGRASPDSCVGALCSSGEEGGPPCVVGTGGTPALPVPPSGSPQRAAVAGVVPRADEAAAAGGAAVTVLLCDIQQHQQRQQEDSRSSGDSGSGQGEAGSGSSSGATSTQREEQQQQQEEERAVLLRCMCEHLNLLQWQRVDVDTGHYHAHAAVVVRSAVRFAASHGHVVEFALRQMRDGV